MSFRLLPVALVKASLCQILSHGSRKQLNTLGAKPSKLSFEQDSRTISVCIGKVSFLQFCTSNPLADTFRPTTLVVGELQVQSMSCRLLCKRTCHWDVLLVTLDWPKTADKLDKLDKVYDLCGRWRNLQNTQWVSGCCLLLWRKHPFVRFCSGISFKKLYQPSVSKNQCNCTKVCTLCKLSHASRQQLSTLGAKPSKLESEQDSRTISVCLAVHALLENEVELSTLPLHSTLRPAYWGFEK